MGYKIGLLALGFFCLMSNIQAQNVLEKADKYYDLYAFQEAIKYYEQALQSRPNDYNAASRLAECYLQLRDFTKARRWYAKAVESPNAEPVDIFYYGQVLRAEERYREAKARFLEYAKTEPTLGNHYADACDYALANAAGNSQLPVSPINGINSSSADFAPAFYRNKLFFSTFRKRNSNASDDFNQLYTATRTGSNVDSAQPLHQDFQAIVNESNVSFSDDGRQVAFVKNNNNFTSGIIPLIGSGVKLDIYLANVVSQNDWQNEEAFPYNGRKYSNGYPHLTAEGNAIYFASDVPGGYGGFDIYISEKIDNTWSEPVNLGATINTGGDEISPFLLQGNTLFFASNWHDGYGGLDIFKSLNIDNTWKQVINMGKGINSPRDDYDFIYDKSQKVGFFTSNRVGGSGYSDIYQTEGVLVATPPTTNTANVPVENMLITLHDEITGKPLEAVKIDFTRCSGRTYNTDSNGTAILDYFDQDCTILISKNGYVDQLYKLPFIAQLDIKLTPLNSKAKPEVKGFIQRLESRKHPFRMLKRIGKNEKYLEKITASDFINFGGLTCGDHVSKAIDIYGTNYILRTDSYKYDNGSFVLHVDKNQKIIGIDIFGIEGVEFMSSKVNDNRIYLMGLETYKILDFAIGEGTLNKDRQYRYYEFGTHSLELTATRNNHYIVSEIFVRWDTNRCSTY